MSGHVRTPDRTAMHTCARLSGATSLIAQDAFASIRSTTTSPALWAASRDSSAPFASQRASCLSCSFRPLAERAFSSVRSREDMARGVLPDHMPGPSSSSSGAGRSEMASITRLLPSTRASGSRSGRRSHPNTRANAASSVARRVRRALHSCALRRLTASSWSPSSPICRTLG